MTLKQYLSFMGIVTLVIWTLAALIVLSVNPFEASPIVLAAFYLTLFLALAGSFSLVGFILRMGLFGRDRIVSLQVFVAFRQALLLSALLVTTMMLKGAGYLNFLSFLVTLIVLTGIEFISISLRVRRK